jgi:hypothetical protein
MFVKLKPESYEVGPDGKPTNPQPITFDAFFEPNAGQNVRMGERKGNELFHVSSINRSFENEYLDAWRKKFNIRMGRAGQEFDIAALEDQATLQLTRLGAEGKGGAVFGGIGVVHRAKRLR